MTHTENLLVKKLRTTQRLTADKEKELATAWREHGDRKAYDELVTAFFQFAMSEANRFKHSGLPIDDLIQEASMGLMRAADKFDPEMGYRFATYARYWIVSKLREYTAQNRGIVRAGKSNSQRKIFSNLSRVRNDIEREAAKEFRVLKTQEIHEEIARRLEVPVEDVVCMDGYIKVDYSLNAPMNANAEPDAQSWIDTLEDEGINSTDIAESSIMTEHQRGVIANAFCVLTDRERVIIAARKMAEEPRSLESLGQQFKVSRERIRQVESAAMKKIKAHLDTAGHGAQLLAA